VIVATGPFHTPYTPPCNKSINKDILQIHSEFYKSPSQLQDGDTLVVGAGDSGVQILDEISNTNRKVFFSGDSTIGSLPQEFLGKTLWWWLKTTRILSANKYSWFGKKLMSRTQPIIGTDTKALFKKENISCIGRTLSANENEIIFKDCKISTIKNIIWATGFRPNFNWIEGEELCKHGYPNHYRGISNTEGLFYIGLPWLYTRGSATLGGVSTDAFYLSQYIKNKDTSTSSQLSITRSKRI
jgi:putative flavoprotein involved in K+ transport